MACLHACVRLWRGGDVGGLRCQHTLSLPALPVLQKVLRNTQAHILCVHTHTHTQVLQSLAFLHSLGLVHSDLKPENILIKSYSRCVGVAGVMLWLWKLLLWMLLWLPSCAELCLTFWCRMRAMCVRSRLHHTLTLHICSSHLSHPSHAFHSFHMSLITSGVR